MRSTIGAMIGSSGHFRRWSSRGVAGVALLLLACANAQAPPPPEGYQGIVELDQRSLAFDVGGRLLEVSANQGDVVEPGAVLARLDSTLPALELRALDSQVRATKAELDLLYQGTRPEVIEQARARLRAAEAELATRQRDFDRTQALFRSGTLPEQEIDVSRLRWDQARAAAAGAEQLLKELRRGPRAKEIEASEARLDAAKSSAESARERIRRHELFSDGNAEVLDVPRRFGEYVAPGTTVVTLADTTRPYVDVFVPQGEVSRLNVGAPVTVRVDAIAQPLGGRVEHIGHSMEYSPRFLFSPAERPYLVLRARIRIRDDERKIQAGVPAFVELGAPPSLLLPEAPGRKVARPKSRDAEGATDSQTGSVPAPGR